MSLGVRLETRAEVLAAIGVEHPDLKITQLEQADRKTKTLCFVAARKAVGSSSPIYQGVLGRAGDHACGHEATERVAGARPLAANFGLLCQIALPGTMRP